MTASSPSQANSPQLQQKGIGKRPQPPPIDTLRKDLIHVAEGAKSLSGIVQEHAWKVHILKRRFRRRFWRKRTFKESSEAQEDSEEEEADEDDDVPLGRLLSDDLPGWLALSCDLWFVDKIAGNHTLQKIFACLKINWALKKIFELWSGRNWGMVEIGTRTSTNVTFPKIRVHHIDRFCVSSFTNISKL